MNDNNQNNSEMKIIDAILSDTAKPASGRTRTGSRRGRGRTLRPAAPSVSENQAEAKPAAAEPAAEQQPAKAPARRQSARRAKPRTAAAEAAAVSGETAAKPARNAKNSP